MTGNLKQYDVAIIHRYFWPQNYPYAIMLREIAEGMAESGLSVIVYSSTEPGSDQAKERREWGAAKGIDVAALPLYSERGFSVWKKAAQTLLYALWVFWVSLRCRSRVVWVGTTPPLIMGFLLRSARIFRQFKVVYHCQDIHPEALFINGNLSNHWLMSFLKKLDTKSVHAADAVITLSEDMKKTLRARPCRTGNVHVINNFILEDIPYKEEKKSEVRPHRLLFAGSLGRFQNLDFLLEVVVKLALEQGVETTFMGDGPLRAKMEKKVKQYKADKLITFTGHRPLSEAVFAMQESDFGLISLTEGVDKVAYPSKTVMYLAAGLPCFAFVDPESSLGQMLNKERLGMAVSPGDVDEAALKISRFIFRKNSPVLKRSEIADYAKGVFSRDVVVGKMVKLVEGMLR